VSNVAAVAIPLITGIGGLLIGAGFTRVTSRNDQRRNQYAEALSAVESLVASSGEDAVAVEKAQQRVVEIGHWLELDSVPVSNAFKVLLRDASASPANSRTKVAEAREHFVDVAHKYSSWRLPQRLWLQARTKRLRCE
jgi:hypothetical protein